VRTLHKEMRVHTILRETESNIDIAQTPVSLTGESFAIVGEEKI
jgi:hypothetical protein